MSDHREDHRPTLSHAELLELRRWNTPTIYNGWEQITRRDPASEGFNPEETRDFMPGMGPMIGHAVTVVIEPSEPRHPRENPGARAEYLESILRVPAPRIVVVQDLDRPATAGSFWGEVNANVHRALGCVGTITDGAIRDVDEMADAGFKALARRLCVGHAHSHPVRWDVPVEVFGRTVRPGDLIHADAHGFLVIPPEDQPGLLEASRFMDSCECQTVIPAAREAGGKSHAEILEALRAASAAFGERVRERFGRSGEF